MKKILFLLLAILVACTPANQVLDNSEHENKAMDEDWSAEEMAEMEKDHESSMEPRVMEPNLIGGSSSRYYNWDKSLFNQAVADNKIIFLEFSANWCSVCKNQEPHLIAGFTELDDPSVVGFKIHYKDDETTDEHEALAREYVIAYQHTKRVVKNGEVVLKSPEAWEKDKFVSEMRALTNG